MIQDIMNPIHSIDKAKKTKNTQTQILTLIIASLLMSIATAIIATQTIMTADILIISLTTLVGFFTFMIINTAIYSFLIKLITKKGTFYDSLTAIAQASLIFSAGATITALALLIPSAGFLIGLIALFATIITSIAIFFRAIMTMTNTTILEILVTTLIIIVGLVIAMQIILAIQLIIEPISQNVVQELQNNMTMN